MPDYIGRFAPSPTGLLHLGSLIGALASYLDARAAQGLWLLRMENLDPPREMQGAAQAILGSLLAHGLQWDGQVLWQSQRLKAYTLTVDHLLQQGQAYYCTCSRADLKVTNGIHAGRCRECSQQPSQAFAIRVQLPNTVLKFTDAIQGPCHQHLQQTVGDTIVQRKDTFYAYQLAVVVDDAYQNITHVVRGSDLLDSSPRQIALQKLLGLPTPHYAHVPVITNQQGQKLSKQTFAKALCERDATTNLLKALAFLQQTLPPMHLSKNTQSILAWAIDHWVMAQIPHKMSITE